MHFTPHQKLIELLVGQQLYTSADAAMRELLQNAEDACSLQELKGPSYGASILVRYSAGENWVEVQDNGLGMNREAVEMSFSSVGAPKDAVSHIRELLQQSGSRQIAQFGIGVLSCFGVADSISVRTKMDADPGLSFVVRDYNDDFEELTDLPAERGTTMRLQLKPNGPMQVGHVAGAVERYVRHAAHVEMEDVDNGQRRSLVEKWEGAELPETIRIEDPAVRDGYLALDPTWENPNATLGFGLTLCNAGFLVTQREPSLLPQQAIGYRGELDVKPGELSILLNREGFSHDERWKELGRRLLVKYNQLVRTRILQWEATLNSSMKSIEEQGVDRGLLILRYGPPQGILEPETHNLVAQMIPRAIRIALFGSDSRISIASAIDRSRSKGAIYFIREGEGARQFQQSLRQGAGTVQFTETAQTESLRAAHLRAKGATVVSCRQRTFPYESADGTNNISVHEADILTQEAQRAGMRCVSVNDATPEEVELGVAEESKLLSDLLGLEEQIRLIRLDTSSDAVIRDYAGRLLNSSNEEIREILAALPEAVGNPVRKALLQIYMDLSNYRIDSARLRAKQLLVDPNLHEHAQLSTGQLLRNYLMDKLRPLIREEKEHV
jgi:hypothetical protein